MSETEGDPGIDAYRRALVAADLAADDVAELEDHLRALADELRATGLPAAIAVREAAHRLGDPQAIAREHARVRSPYGAPLSRARAWSAALLLAPYAALATVDVYYTGVAVQLLFTLGIAIVMLGALALRVPWARAAVLGALIAMTIPDLIEVATSHYVTPYEIMRLICEAGAVAFLAPWRRGELPQPARAVAFLGPAYASATAILQATTMIAKLDLSGAIAMPCVFATLILGLRRSRWAVVPGTLGALALVGATAVRWQLHALAPIDDVAMIASMMAGAAGLAASGALFRVRALRAC